MSEDTYLLVKNAVRCLPVATVTPKNLSDPIQLYRVIDEEDEEKLILFDAEGISLSLESKRLSPKAKQQLKDIVLGLDEQE